MGLGVVWCMGQGQRRGSRCFVEGGLVRGMEGWVEGEVCVVGV